MLDHVKKKACPQFREIQKSIKVLFSFLSLMIALLHGVIFMHDPALISEYNMLLSVRGSRFEL